MSKQVYALVRLTSVKTNTRQHGGIQDQGIASGFNVVQAYGDWEASVLRYIFKESSRTRARCDLRSMKDVHDVLASQTIHKANNFANQLREDDEAAV